MDELHVRLTNCGQVYMQGVCICKTESMGKIRAWLARPSAGQTACHRLGKCSAKKATCPGIPGGASVDTEGCWIGTLVVLNGRVWNRAHRMIHPFVRSVGERAKYQRLEATGARATIPRKCLLRRRRSQWEWLKFSRCVTRSLRPNACFRAWS